MSRSLKRVEAALIAAGCEFEIKEMSQSTRTAAEAAAAAGCALDQIAKSILFAGAESGGLRLFLTAGGQQVCAEKAARLAGEPLVRAEAKLVREITGFAIGGVAPVGHLTALPVFMDHHLTAFDLLWAAAGTPNHIFAIAPEALQRLTGAQIADFTS